MKTKPSEPSRLPLQVFTRSSVIPESVVKWSKQEQFVHWCQSLLERSTNSASDAVNLVLSLGTALLSNSCSPSWRRILKSFLCQNVAYCFSLFLFSFFPRTVGVSLLAADAIYETKPVLGEFSLKKKKSFFLISVGTLKD